MYIENLNFGACDPQGFGDLKAWGGSNTKVTMHRYNATRGPQSDMKRKHTHTCIMKTKIYT